LDHEAGGKFATNVITGTYVKGQTISIQIKITAPHGGRFSFGVCPVPDGASPATERRVVTQACLDRNRLTGLSGPYWWLGKQGAGNYTMEFKLPAGIVCKRCVLQWHYETGNSCTIPGTPAQHVISPNMVSCATSPNMEEFWNCADISIVDRKGAKAPVMGAAPAKVPPKAIQQPGIRRPFGNRLGVKERFGAVAFSDTYTHDAREGSDASMAAWGLLAFAVAAALASLPLAGLALGGFGLVAVALALALWKHHEKRHRRRRDHGHAPVSIPTAGTSVHRRHRGHDKPGHHGAPGIRDEHFSVCRKTE
jgi:hypothetical protein